MIWVAKNLYFFNCLLDGAHTNDLKSVNATASFFMKIVWSFAVKFDKSAVSVTIKNVVSLKNTRFGDF